MSKQQSLLATLFSTSRRAVAVWVTLMVIASTVTVVQAPAASAAAAWQFTVTRVDPSPLASGTDMRFRFQLQCSAVDENECLDTEIRWADTGLTKWWGGEHPIADNQSGENYTNTWPDYGFQGNTGVHYDAATNEWVLDLQDVISAGTSVEIDVIASAPNHVTPDGESFVLDATLTSANTPEQTATDSGAWTAQADIDLHKYVPTLPEPDTITATDTTIRYFIVPCDPSFGLDPDGDALPGHLFLQDATIIDTLPPGTVFIGASAGGAYDAANETVTWNTSGMVSTWSANNCSWSSYLTYANAGVGDPAWGSNSPIGNGTEYWIDVQFPSGTFTHGDFATNFAEIDAYPYGSGNLAEDLLEDDASVLHEFVAPGIGGRFTKNADTEYFDSHDWTFEDDFATYFLSASVRSINTIPFYFDVFDPLPCLDNMQVILGGAINQYESLDPNDPSYAPCQNMAFTPDQSIQIQIWHNSSNWTQAAFASAYPTIPLEYTTTLGNTGTMNVPLDPGFNNTIINQYLLGAPLTALGLAAGEEISDLYFDSRAVDLQGTSTTASSYPVFKMWFNGTVAPDTPAYPVKDTDRVWNDSHWSTYDDEVGDAVGTSIASDEIHIVEQPILGAHKYTTSGGHFNLEADFSNAGFTPEPGEQIVVSDLLPVGYTFNQVTSIGYRVVSQDGSSVVPWTTQGPPGSFLSHNPSITPAWSGIDPWGYIDLEVIPNYAGTGRTLVRATYDEPPTYGWKNTTGSGPIRITNTVLQFSVEPSDFRLSATNTVRVFPTDADSMNDLLCFNANVNAQTLPFGYPADDGSDFTAALTNDTNDWDGDGIDGSGDTFCESTIVLPPDPTVLQIDSFKAVQGDLDPAMRPFPAIGDITTSGGTGTFQINMTNVGAIALEDVVIYDILPHIGDTGLSSTQVGTGRLSEWDAIFAGIDPATLPAGAQVEYSLSYDPCRGELDFPSAAMTSWPPACVNDWTATPPASIGDVKALRITFVDDTGDLLQFDSAENISIEYDVTYPAGLAPGEVAWNSFAYAGNRVDDGTAILAAEPPKVGLSVPMVDLNIAKSVSGPSVTPVGIVVDYEVTIDHEGNVTPDGVYTLPASTAYDVTGTDNGVAQGLTIVPGTAFIYQTATGADNGATFDPATGDFAIPEVGPNDTYTIVYQAYSSVAAVINNTAEIMSHSADDIDSVPGNGDPDEDDIATATHEWAEPSIDLKKLVESPPGSGTFIEADATDGLIGDYVPGQPITYRFVIENTGALALQDVELTDNLIGFDCDETIGNLAPSEVQTVDCVWPYGFVPPAGSANYVNTATVKGFVFGYNDDDYDFDGDGESDFQVSDSDTAEIRAEEKQFDLALVKTLSAAQLAGDGAAVTAGDTVQFTITVTNQGDFDADTIVVTDYVTADADGSGAADWTFESLDTTATTTSPSGTAASVTDLGASGGDHQFGIDSLAIGESVSFDLTLRLDAAFDHANFSAFNWAEISAADDDADVSTSAPVDVDSTPDVNNGLHTESPLSEDDEIGEDAKNTADTDPADGFSDGDTDLNGDLDEDDHDFVQLAVSAVPVEPVYSIGNMIFIDFDRDGIFNNTDSVVPAVTVLLLDAAGAVIDSTFTDATGLYLFDDLEAGNYQVKIDDAEFAAGGDLAQYVPTIFSATPDDDIDNDSNGMLVGTSVVSGSITLGDTEPTGEDPDNDAVTPDDNENLTVDFGFYRPTAEIGDRVWYDLDHDGVQDADEPGVEGVTVELIDAGGNVVDTMLTDENGNYLFVDLTPGDYKIVFGLPTGWTSTRVGAGDDDALDNDGMPDADDPLMTMTEFTTLDDRESDRTWDQGIYRNDFNLTIDKTAANYQAGDTEVTWEIVVANEGPEVAPGTITVVDTLPAGLELATSATGQGWSCDISSRTITCETNSVFTAGQSLPSITLVTPIATTFEGQIGNSADVSSDVSGESTTTDNKATDWVTISAKLTTTSTTTPTGNTSNTGTRGPLAFTGRTAEPFVGLALSLLTLGVALTALSRRRENER